MKKKAISLLTMLFVMLFTIDVKADWNPYALKKTDSYNSYFDWMPTDIKKGDIITVKVSTQVMDNSKINYGTYAIRWDEKAFEIVENNGKYYTLKNEDVEITNYDLYNDNKYYIEFYGNDTLYDDNYYVGTPLFEFKFRVLSDAKDGIYRIYQSEGESLLNVELSEGYGGGDANLRGYDNELRFQIGKEKIVSNYTPDTINSNSYIIGNHLFTREGSEAYPGRLTTEYIMLASKSIESDNKDDMIIYVKNASGIWKNAITNDEINPPEKFNISYIDMISNYSNNGLYSTDTNNEDNYTILALTQISDKKAIVTIEVPNETVHAVGTINGKIVTFSVSGKNYKITIGDNEVNIETNDANITDLRLQKKVNYDVNDYYSFEYGNKYYLKSEASGKYVLGNNEIYLVQLSSTSYKVCIKNKASNKCEIKDGVYGDEDYLTINDKYYGYIRNEEGIKLTSDEDNTYVGTYVKQSNITMEDIFSLEENYIMYTVIYSDDYNCNTDCNAWGWEYVKHGEKLEGPGIPEKDGFNFVGWQLNGEIYDLNTPVTSSMELHAKWEVNIPTPVISVGESNNWYDRWVAIENYNEYCSNSVCNVEDSNVVNFAGFEVYEKVGSEYIYVGDGNNGDNLDLPYYEFTMEPNTTRTFVARVYIFNGEERVYSGYSNEVESDATIPTPVAIFTETANDSVDYSSYNDGTYTYKINVENLRDFGYEWNDDGNEWYVLQHKVDGFDLFEMVDNHLQPPVGFDGNNSAEISVSVNDTRHYYVKAYLFVDGSKVYSALSNELVPESPIPTPVINGGMGDDTIVFGLMINNSNDYCIGECSGSESDEYIVDGYEIYEKVGLNYNLIKTINKVVDDDEFIENTLDESENKVFAVRMFINHSGGKVYSNYSNEIILQAAPELSACYTHNNDEYTWGHYNGIEGYIKVMGRISEETCIPELKCYYNSDDESYHWTASPDVNWSLLPDITSEETCVSP